MLMPREGSAGRCVLHGDTKARVKCTAGVHGGVHSKRSGIDSSRRCGAVAAFVCAKALSPRPPCSSLLHRMQQRSCCFRCLRLTSEQRLRGQRGVCVQATHVLQPPDVACLRQAHQPSTSLDLVDLPHARRPSSRSSRRTGVVQLRGASRGQRCRTALRRAWPATRSAAVDLRSGLQAAEVTDWGGLGGCTLTHELTYIICRLGTASSALGEP